MRGISKIAAAGCAVLALASVASTARADDPRDPAMRSAQARARDAAAIRKLNRDQFASVSQRDAGYQQQWSDYRRYHEADGENAYAAPARDSAQDDYARARSDYEASLAQWRRDVSACRNGNYDRCAN